MKVKSGVNQGLTGVAFLSDRVVRVENIFELGAQELGRSSEGVTILAESSLVLSNVDLLVVNRGERRSLEQDVDISGCLDLGRIND